MKKILLWSFLFVNFESVVGFADWAAASENPSAPTVKKNRAYPGGLDEEEIRVQEELRAPVITLDRRTIEQRVLKGTVKKAEDETGSANKTQ